MRRKRTFRTSVAIAMALCMVAMLFPASAYAEKSGETVGGGTITTETDIAGKIGATPQTNETNNPAETGTAPQTTETKSPAETGTMPQTNETKAPAETGTTPQTSETKAPAETGTTPQTSETKAPAETGTTPQTNETKAPAETDATPQTKESAPALILPQALEGMAGQTLETIVLPDGWVWASPDTVLSEDITEYAARFMVDDRTYDYTADAGYNADGHYVEAVLTISFTKVDDMKETMESGVMFLSNTLGIEIASQFPDTEFQKYITDNFDNDPKNGYLSQKEIDKVSTIKVPWRKEIKSVEGIECFTKLTYLDCQGTSITGLDVSNNSVLGYLNCSFTDIPGLNVHNNSELYYLDCSYTDIDTLDVRNNIRLVTLYCQEIEAPRLDVKSNYLLANFNCYAAKIQVLELGKHDNLDNINCSSTQINSLNVDQCPKLTNLNCADCKNLQNLNVDANTELKILDCSRTPIKDLRVDKNPSLEHLSCYSTGIGQLKLENNLNLKNLYCQYTEIADLVLSNNLKLEELQCFNTKISALDLSANTKLKKLSCAGTYISGLDVSGNTSLTSMNTDLQYGFLNVGNNPSLQLTSVYDSAWYFTPATGSSFNIKNLFPGIDISKMTVTNGIKLESDGTVSGYSVTKPELEYDYDCGTTIDGPLTLPVRVSLTFPSSIKIKNAPNKAYDGMAAHLEADDLERTGSEEAVSYTWERWDGTDWKTISEAPVNVGKYRVTAHVGKSGILFDAADSAPVEFAIRKGVPPYTVPDDLSADIGQTLRDVSLPSGFTWVDEGQSVGAAGKNTFKAVFTPDDTDNYEIVQDIDVEVTVKRLDSTVIIHKDLNKTYDGKAVALAAGDTTVTGSSGALTYIWEKDNGSGYEPISEAPVNAGSYRVTAHVAADSSYDAADSAPVEFTIQKAAPVWTAPANLSAVYGQTLKDVSLPDGFTWADTSQSVGNVGVHTFKAVFTPDDTVNYEIVQDIDVEVSVKQSGSTVVIHKDLNKTYDGKAVALTAGDITVTGSSGALTYIWEKDNGSGYEAIPEAPVNAGSYRVTAHVAADLSYAAADSAPVEFTIKKAVPVWTAPADLSAVYGQTLRDVSLPTGFAWVDEDQSVGAVGKNTFKAVFTPDDTDNYEIVQGIDVEVSVMQYGSTVVIHKDLNKTYDGKAVALTAGDITVTGSSGALTYIWEKDNGSGYEAIPEAPVNAGSYRVTAHVAADLSYAAADSTPVEFTIQKAAPVWTAPADISAVYGQTLKDVSLPAGFTWADASQSVGNVGVHTFKAVFTPDDTDNYEIVQNIDVKVTVKKADTNKDAPKDTAKTGDSTYPGLWAAIMLLSAGLIVLLARKKIKKQS